MSRLHISVTRSATLTLSTAVLLVASIILLLNLSVSELLFAATQPSPNLLQNGSFEDPIVTRSAEWDIFSDGTQGLVWRVRWEDGQPATYGSRPLYRPEPATLEIQRGVAGFTHADGNQHAELDTDWDRNEYVVGEPALINIFQDVSTVPGAEYELHYGYGARPNTSANENRLVIRINGVQVDLQEKAGGSSGINWSDYAYSFVAKDDTTRVEFAAGGEANGTGALLDDVRLYQVNETTSFTCGISTVTDADGNIYNTIEINNQCWMAENLNLGTMITGGERQTDNGTVEKYCYDNDPANCAADGGLYHWDEAMQFSTTEGAQGLCPAGWHMPTDSEWHALESYLTNPGALCDSNRIGGSTWQCNGAGTALKEGGSSGFNMTPGAYDIIEGFVHGREETPILQGGYYWTSSRDSNGDAWLRSVNFEPSITGTVRFAYPYEYGWSIRCIQGDGAAEPDPEPKEFMCGTSDVQDSDGNTYGTAQIGDQCWMTENMRVGTMVQGTTEQTNNSTVEKYCYNNDPANCTTDGGLYQWDEAMQYSPTEGAQGICPAGWHVPTDGEWYALESHLKDPGQACESTRDGSNKAYGWGCFPAGTKLMTSTSDLVLLPLAGTRGLDGAFYWDTVNGYNWSSSKGLSWTVDDGVHPMYIGSSTAWGRFLTTYSGWSEWDRSGVSRFRESYDYGFSVRCIKDSATDPEPTNTPPVVTLLGDNPLTITQGSLFVDPGATAWDAEDGDLTDSIGLSGDIDLATPGDYLIGYTVVDSDDAVSDTVLRTVRVVEKDNIPPVCSIVFTNNDQEIETAPTNEFIDIDLSGSEEDGQITEVRFLVEDNVNGEPDDYWMNYYDWDTSFYSGGSNWDAQTKSTRWAFPSADTYEVWIELEDDDGNTTRCSKTIDVKSDFVTYTPGWPSLDLEVTKKNLVVITHGWNDSSDSWMQLKSDIETVLADKDRTDWEVVIVDWEKEADQPLPFDAYINAKRIGLELGRELSLMDLENVHFVAHSAGSSLIHHASVVLNNSSNKPRIYNTYLDAFTPMISDGQIYTTEDLIQKTLELFVMYQLEPYGLGADYAEHYLDQRFLPWTSTRLIGAINFDVTTLDPEYAEWNEKLQEAIIALTGGLGPRPSRPGKPADDPIGDIIDYISHGHSWPREYYRQSVLNKFIPGFPFSEEFGVLPPPEEERFEYCLVSGTLPSPSYTCDTAFDRTVQFVDDYSSLESLQAGVRDGFLDPTIELFTDTYVLYRDIAVYAGEKYWEQVAEPGGELLTKSVTGIVDILSNNSASTRGKVFRARTQSPAWGSLQVVTESMANSLEYHYSINGEVTGPGQLSVFVDGNLVDIIDVDTVEPDMVHYRLIPLPQSLDTGIHHVTFRIDPLSEQNVELWVHEFLLSNIEYKKVVDDTAPITTITIIGESQSDIYLEEVTIQLEATDDTNHPINILSTEYSFDGKTWHEYTAPVEVIDEGAHTIYYRSTDWFGNVEETKSVTFTIVTDSTPPVTTLATAGTGGPVWFRSDIELTLSATDDKIGVASTTSSLDNGTTWLNYSAPFTVTGEGKHTVLYRSIDKAGNTEDTKTATLYIDLTAPEARISADVLSKDLRVTGKDNMGSTTVAKTATGYTITDEAGHTTKLLVTKKWAGKALTMAQLTGIQYDDAPAVTLPKTQILYVWTPWKGVTNLTNQTVHVNKTFTVNATYLKPLNRTTVTVAKDGKAGKPQTFPGHKLVTLTTEKGAVWYEL